MKDPVVTRAVGGLTVVAALCLFGCAQERDPINRVQANAMAKSFFVGADLQSPADDPEFYKRGTLIDVDYGAGQEGLFTSTYAQPVSRIRWEITEDALNARLSYERIVGTDNKGNQYNGVGALKSQNDGQIVASYKILSHFDIKNDYNPQTGEKLNVIVENTTDRPWYLRESFRVDWSKNLIPDSYDYDTLSLLGVIGDVKYEPFAYTVMDPASDDAPHFDADGGYFDVTNKAYATPGMVDLQSLGFGPGSIPACFLPSSYVNGGTDPWGNCNPVQLTIRESYRKVVDTDYEPMDMDGVRFEYLGAFNFSYRRGYDRAYGLVDNQWSRFIARYNLWDRSHYYADPDKMTGPVACATKATTEDPTGDPSADPNRDLDGNGTADECEAAGAGSRCDIYTSKCTLPYRARAVKSIPWYIAGDMSLFDPTNWAVLEWDLAMRTAVRTARLVECRKTGAANCEIDFPMWSGQQDDIDEATRIARDVDACRRDKGWDSTECTDMAHTAAANVAAERGNAGDAGTLAIGDIVAMPPVIVLCHNPVTDKDAPACGKPGLMVRQGDIRYNQVLNIEHPQQPSAWGIMTDGDDPITGEKVAGAMNVWTSVTDQAAQQLVDLVRYANRELPVGAITNGSYVADWATANKLGSAGALPTMSRSEINARLASVTTIDPARFASMMTGGLDPGVKAVIEQGREAAEDARTSTAVPSAAAARMQSTLNMARGTPVETALMNKPMVQLAGVGQGVAITGAAADRVSPLDVNNPLVANRLWQMQQNALAERGACVIDQAPEPSGLSGLADILAQKFPRGANETPSQQNDRYSAMVNYVRRRYHYSVISHEMGHSIGLRHNFVSSSAPLFYRPQYWQLRTKNGAIKTECTDAVTDGATCVGPRYWDPLTTDEQSQLIWMWMQSTVMDYPGDVSQDMLGLGVTDFAAARFFYGDTVSVYADPTYKAGSAIGTGITAATDTFGGLLGIRYGLKGSTGNGVDDFHYSQLQNLYTVIKDCVPVTPQQPASWDESVDGPWDPVLDGHIVSVDGQPTKCRQQPVDYVSYGSLAVATAAQANTSNVSSGPSIDRAGRPRVPYAFATDHWADLGNASVYRHDNGADPYEQVQFMISTKENRHLLDNYRRNRTGFSLLSAAQRSFSRYNDKMQGLSAGMGFLASIYRDIGTNQGYAFDSLWPFIVDLAARDNVIASTVVFDHFVRELARPEPGPHYKRSNLFQDPVLHSAMDPDDYGPGGTLLGQTMLAIPNGTTGYLRDVGFGGHLLENALASDKGDFNVEYYENCGSYYDKASIGLLMSLSEDRFVSQSRRDFYDARFRAVGMADILPDGFRRVIANALTGDRSILAPRVETDSTGLPVLNTGVSTSLDPYAARYPKRPLGWPSMWPASGPKVCFSSDGRNVCSGYSSDGNFAPANIASTAAVDPQIGWEVQKFLIMWTVSLIKANEKTTWTDMMRLWRIGQNTAPDIDQRIEWQDPASGELYYARTSGTECLFGDPANACAGGQIVQKGIAARVLEYANQLTAKGYKLDVTTYPATASHPAGFNEFGRAMILRQPSGAPIVRQDPAIQDVTPIGTLVDTLECDQNLTPTCTPLTVTQNHWAYELESYKSVPDYLWQAEEVYGWFGPPSPRGTY